MATWQEIGIDNFQAGRELLDGKRYRSSVSRFYYAAFSILTHELSRAGVKFGNNLETPSHQGLPKLLKLHLTLPMHSRPKMQCVIPPTCSAAWRSIMIDEKPLILDEKQIVEIVKRYLEPYQPLDYRLHVMDDGVRHSRDDW